MRTLAPDAGISQGYVIASRSLLWGVITYPCLGDSLKTHKLIYIYIYISVYWLSSPGSVQPRRYIRTNEKIAYFKSPTSKTNGLKSESERFGLRLFTLLDSDSSDLTITSPAYYTNDTYANFLDESWLVKADEGKVSGRTRHSNVECSCGGRFDIR